VKYRRYPPEVTRATWVVLAVAAVAVAIVIAKHYA
jgi:hypothetical protein